MIEEFKKILKMDVDPWFGAMSILGFLGVLYAIWTLDLVYVLFLIIFTLVFTELNYVLNFDYFIKNEKITKLTFFSSITIKIAACLLAIPFIFFCMAIY